MKRIYHILLIAVASVLWISCDSHGSNDHAEHSAEESNPSTEQTEVGEESEVEATEVAETVSETRDEELEEVSTEEPTAQSAEDDGTADLILSFYSPGNGIDRDAYKAVKAFLAENYSDLAVSTVKWGKEGEVDLCFDFSALSAEDAASLKTSLQEMVSNSEKVRVKENEACRTPRSSRR